MKPTINVIEMNYLEECCKKALASSDAALVETQLKCLIKDYSLINYMLGYNFPLWRGRKCESPSGFKSLNELSYPPAKLTKTGRLNYSGKPVLYASFNKFCVFEEIGAKEGEYIHLIGYRIKKPKKIRCCVIGEVLNVHRSGHAWASVELGQQLNKILNKIPPKVACSFVYIDAFFSSILRDVKASSKNNYLHSSILSCLLFEKLKEVDAILYPSVALESAMNIAILPGSADSILEVAGTSIIHIDKKYEYGIYDFTLVRNAKGNFTNDSSIIWE